MVARMAMGGLVQMIWFGTLIDADDIGSLAASLSSSALADVLRAMQEKEEEQEVLREF